jgi:hypothetical protein
MVTAREIAEALGQGKEVRQSDGGWTTVCPAHNDSSPSLSVREKNGKVLVKCHAGCDQTDVINALRDRDLWPKQFRHKTWKVISPVPDGIRPPKGQAHYKHGSPSKVWEYQNLRGELIGFIYRFDLPNGGKEILPLTYCHAEEDGERQWRWKSFDKPRPLYRGQYLKDNLDLPILVVEGEKAADEAVKIFKDFVVVSWPGGAEATKFASWEGLKGRDVTIWPDNDEPGLKAAGDIAEILTSVQAKSVRLVKLPEGLPEGWDLADEVPEDVNLDRRSCVITAPEFTPAGDTVIDRMNMELGLVILGDKPMIIWDRYDEVKKRSSPSFVGLAAVRAFYANEFVTVGRKEMPVVDFWMQHPQRKSYNNVVFEPGRTVRGAYNLWRGFSYSPDPTGDWSMLDEHIRQNVCQGDESLYNWVIAWFAQMIQNPQEKPGTSLSIRGRQGAGKTVVGEHVGALFRDNYVLVDDTHYVVGNFNSHMSQSLMLQADEGFFAGDPRIVGRLKGMVTSPTNRIEYKGKDSFEINNYQRLMITGNEEWIVPAAFEERRFAVLTCGDGRMQDRAYFRAMSNQMKNGGYEGLLYHLQNLDISTVDVGVIPETRALGEQKQFSLLSTQKFWFERLQMMEILPNSGIWGNVSIEELYEAYIKRAMQWGIQRRAPSNQFGKELAALMPGGVVNRTREDLYVRNERGGMEIRRIWQYKIPDIHSCRKAYEMVVGIEVDWGEYAIEAPPQTELEPPVKDDDMPF